MAHGSGEPDDEQLLLRAAFDEDAFATFYARFERPVVAFFVRAVGRGDLAADLTVEVFAVALESVGMAPPSTAPTRVAWLSSDGHALRLLTAAR